MSSAQSQQNTTVASVSFRMTAAGDIADFNESATAVTLAIAVGTDPSAVQINASAASVDVGVTIRTANITQGAEIFHQVSDFDSTLLTSMLGISVLDSSRPTLALEEVSTLESPSAQQQQTAQGTQGGSTDGSGAGTGSSGGSDGSSSQDSTAPPETAHSAVSISALTSDDHSSVMPWVVAFTLAFLLLGAFHLRRRCIQRARARAAPSPPEDEKKKYEKKKSSAPITPTKGRRCRVSTDFEDPERPPVSEGQGSPEGDEAVISSAASSLHSSPDKNHPAGAPIDSAASVQVHYAPEPPSGAVEQPRTAGAGEDAVGESLIKYVMESSATNSAPGFDTSSSPRLPTRDELARKQDPSRPSPSKHSTAPPHRDLRLRPSLSSAQLQARRDSPRGDGESAVIVESKTSPESEEATVASMNILKAPTPSSPRGMQTKLPSLSSGKANLSPRHQFDIPFERKRPPGLTGVQWSSALESASGESSQRSGPDPRLSPSRSVGNLPSSPRLEAPAPPTPEAPNATSTARPGTAPESSIANALPSESTAAHTTKAERSRYGGLWRDMLWSASTTTESKGDESPRPITR